MKTVRAEELKHNSKFNDRDSLGGVGLNLGTNKSLSGYSTVDNSSEDQSYIAGLNLSSVDQQEVY